LEHTKEKSGFSSLETTEWRSLIGGKMITSSISVALEREGRWKDFRDSMGDVPSSMIPAH
jgi:hypothetical protein